MGSARQGIRGDAWQEAGCRERFARTVVAELDRTRVHGGDEDGYAYNVINHTLAPRPFMFVVRSTESRFYTFEIASYHDGAGAPG